MSKITTVLIIGAAMIATWFTFKPNSIMGSKTDTLVHEAYLKVTEEPLVHSFEGWREFSSHPEKFRVMLPSLPQSTADAIYDKRVNDTLQYNTFVASEERGPIIAVTTITYPKEIPSGEIEHTLRSLIDDMLTRNKANKLEYANFNVAAPYPSLDFSLTSNHVLIIGKAVIHKNMAYILTMTDEKAGFNPDELHFFLDSFTLN